MGQVGLAQKSTLNKFPQFLGCFCRLCLLIRLDTLSFGPCQNEPVNWTLLDFGLSFVHLHIQEGVVHLRSPRNCTSAPCNQEKPRLSAASEVPTRKDAQESYGKPCGRVECGKNTQKAKRQIWRDRSNISNPKSPAHYAQQGFLRPLFLWPLKISLSKNAKHFLESAPSDQNSARPASSLPGGGSMPSREDPKTWMNSQEMEGMIISVR